MRGRCGTHRYLLRIETANAELYARIHPSGHSWNSRLECLRTLGQEGFIVGTGVMIGLPGQTEDSWEDTVRQALALAPAHLSFYSLQIEEGTPLYEMFRKDQVEQIPDTPLAAADGERLPAMEFTLKMIALTRMVLPEVNIASTTALQALAPDGRERGILAGANVIMPNVTPQCYRQKYLLYPDKPCTQDSSEFCRGCIERRIEAIGEKIAWGERMDPLHFR